MKKEKYNKQIVFITATSLIFFVSGAFLFWMSLGDGPAIRIYTFVWGLCAAAIWMWMFSRIPKPEPKKYVVVWTEKKFVANKEVYRDGYESFIDGTTEENLERAEKLYEKILGFRDNYCGHICEVVKSTDYL